MSYYFFKLCKKTSQMELVELINKVCVEAEITGLQLSELIGVDSAGKKILISHVIFGGEYGGEKKVLMMKPAAVELPLLETTQFDIDNRISEIRTHLFNSFCDEQEKFIERYNAKQPVQK